MVRQDRKLIQIDGEKTKNFQIWEAIAESRKNIFNLVGQKTQLMVE
ncbi:hypothetical protein [Nostoc sp.]